MLFRSNTVHGPNYTQPPADLIEGQQEWEVERIIQHRKVRARKETWRTEFQVQWKGYEDLTWEPEEHLDHAQDLLSDYWNRQSKKITTLTTKKAPHKGTIVLAYIPSIPARRIKGNLHEHVCEACSEPYQHEHPYQNTLYPQFIGDCPICDKNMS